MDSVYKTLFASKNRKAVGLCGFILVVILLSVYAPKDSRAEDAAPAKNQQLINQKLEEIKKIQADINKYQTDIKAKQKEGNTLKNQIAIYDGNIQKNQLEISETKANIEKTELEVIDAKNTIEQDGKSIEKNKEAIRSLLRELYDQQQSSVLEILIRNDNLSAFFNEVNAMESAQDKLMQTVSRMKQEKIDLAAKNDILAANQEDYQKLIEMRTEQNGSLESFKAQKKEILDLTKGEEGKYQLMANQTQKLLPSLRAELRDLQSLGTDIKFDDAISAAKYVGGVTGVRPALLLAILRVESGLGTNVGGGKYSVDMSPKQRPAFEQITKELGYDPNTMPVSKRPKSYAGWGGAVGPAQMIPTTWLVFRDEVSRIVKKSPPDPWNLTDAIAAVAVKLAKVEGVTAGSYDGEYKAAGIYMAGVNWQKFTFYPDKVMYYADLYQKELDG